MIKRQEIVVILEQDINCIGGIEPRIYGISQSATKIMKLIRDDRRKNCKCEDNKK